MLKHRLKHTPSILAIGLILLSAAPALAVGASSSVVDPSRLLDRLGGGPQHGTPSGGLVIEQQGKEVAPAKGSTEKVFTLNHVVVKGSTVYGENGLQGVYAKWMGQKVSFADLQTIAQAMTVKYRNDGYILSRVVLEPQKIGDGTVYFRAIEGYVSHVTVNGKIQDKALIDAYANKITAQRPLNAKTLERSLLLMNDLPGVTARSVLKPSPTEQGASDLIVQLEDKTFEGSLQGDNRGNRFIGPYELQAVGAVNSAFGAYDRNTLRLMSSSDFDELHYGDFTNELQLGTDGTRLTTRIAAAQTHPGSVLSPLDINGNTELINIGLMYPYIRSREENLFLHTDFQAQNSDNKSLGVKLFEDHVRHIDAEADFDNIDSWGGINRVTGTVTQGLDIFDATSDGTGRSRVNGKQVFTKFNASVTRTQAIVDDVVTLYVSASGQASLDPLLTSEQFAVGGENYGRAYDSAEILGDHGAAGIIELRYRGVPDDTSILNSYEPYIFYDGGMTWLREPLVGEKTRSSLTSTGIGTRFNVLGNTSGYVEVSKPLTKDVASEGDKDTRFFFSLTRRFQ